MQGFLMSILRNTGRVLLLLLVFASFSIAQSTDTTKVESAKKKRTRSTQQTTVATDSSQTTEPVKKAKERQVDKTVYVTRTGEKYHADGCRYLRKSSIAMKLSEAKKVYSPCSVCNP